VKMGIFRDWCGEIDTLDRSWGGRVVDFDSPWVDFDFDFSVG
jgi:hypothetical protein